MFNEGQQKKIWETSMDYEKLINLPVNEYLDLYVNPGYQR
jgi:hypothetical protein